VECQFVMGGACVPAAEQVTGLWRDMGLFQIVAGEGADGVERVEMGEGDELDLVALIRAQDAGAAKAGNCVGGGQEFVLEEALIGVGLVGGRPAAPDSL